MALTEEDINTIETLVKDLIKQKELVEKKERWKPSEGDKYWFFMVMATLIKALGRVTVLIMVIFI